MPKIEVTGLKGLVQSTGSTIPLSLSRAGILDNTVKKVAIIENASAFVQNSRSNVQWPQPAFSYIDSIYLLVTSAPTITVNAATDLGYAVGTASGTGNIVTAHTDDIIDAAGATDALSAGALIELTVNRKTTDAVVLAADESYTSADRNIFLGTTASDHAVAAAGTVKWIIKYYKIA